VAGRQRRDPHAQATRLVEGAAAIDGPGPSRRGDLEQGLGAFGRLLAGFVGVEEEHGVARVPAQELQLRRGEGGAERGHGLREPVLVRHDAVDVALHDEGPLLLAHRFARDVGPVEELPL
jgi:hypothetical protein